MEKLQRIPKDSAEKAEKALGVRIVQPKLLDNVFRMMCGHKAMPIAFIPNRDG